METKQNFDPTHSLKEKSRVDFKVIKLKDSKRDKDWAGVRNCVNIEWEIMCGFDWGRDNIQGV